MNYEQFVREDRALYKTFARTVAAILQAAIDTHPKEFRLQQIQSRAKDPASLRRKLIERSLIESDKIEDELKDLAGCRLIFYTNTDVDRFLNSRLIFENFIIDFDGSKIHRAVGADRTADQLYFAIHYLVSLKPERLALPEYGRYRGLRCEVQIQTILDHAWAETTHDIVYHQQPMGGFGTKQFEEIKARTAKIMNKYLLPAGYEFQKVQHDFERLMQGKELFDRGTLEALDAADNNNDRYDYLHQIKENLLPFYDDVPAMAPELIRVASTAIKKARAVTTTPIETPFGKYDGHTSDQVVNAALEIIDPLRYVDIQGTFRVLCDLYATAGSNEERRRLLQSVDSLAQNDINVWRQVGFAVQKLLFEDILAFGDSERKSLRTVVLTVCRQSLNPEITGTSSSFNTVTLHRGAVLSSDAYAEFRRKALAFLFEMYREADSAGEKLEVIQTLHEATRLPMNAGQTDALVELVLDDTRVIVEFFSELVEGERLETLQHLEHEFLWLYRHSGGMAGLDSEKKVSPRAQALAEAILKFRDRANAIERFVRFKTLVGYESVFPLEWENDAMDIEGPASYRAARLAEYVASITESNAGEWYDIVELCASVKSNDGAMFLSFTEFLKQLSARSPTIVLGYLSKNEELLSPFLPAILDGLEQSERQAEALVLMNSWVDQGRHLAEMARHLRMATTLHLELAKRIADKGLQTKDTIAVIEMIAVIIEKQATSLVDDTLLPGMRYLTSIGDARWVNAVWFMTQLQPFLRSFSEDQCKPLLANLVLRAGIDYHDERVLRAVGSEHPRMVWLFFRDRIEREKTNATGVRYEAVPYQLRELQQTLAQDPGLAIDTVRTWFAPDDNLFQFRGGKMLHNVFPTINGEFEAKLVGLVRNGDNSDIGFVLSLLHSYREGGMSLHNVCKELIERLAEDDKRAHEIEMVLDGTGVVMGEFGFVEAFQRKKQEMEPWLSDPRQKVREFAEKYRRSLDRRVASEQRRSESDHELRRMEWDEE